MKKYFVVFLFLLLLICQPSSAFSNQDLYTTNVARGDTFFDAGSYDQAKDSYISALFYVKRDYPSYTPPVAETGYKVALCYKYLGDYEMAMDSLEITQQYNPDPRLRKVIFEERGNIFLYQGTYSTAQEMFVLSGMSPEAADAKVKDFMTGNGTKPAPAVNTQPVSNIPLTITTGQTTTTLTQVQITNTLPLAPNLPPLSAPTKSPFSVTTAFFACILVGGGVMYSIKKEKN